jgi:hypothetical protein
LFHIQTKLENYANLPASPFTIKKILNSREPNPKQWWNNIKSISGLSKSEPLSSIFHDGEFKRGSELAELIAESFCSVSNSLPPLQFNKLPITSVPDLPLYKYVDDCTVYEIVSRSSPNSTLQANIDSINDWTDRNNMRLNVSKTKELRVSFLKDPLAFDNGKTMVRLSRLPSDKS